MIVTPDTRIAVLRQRLFRGLADDSKLGDLSPVRLHVLFEDMLNLGGEALHISVLNKAKPRGEAQLRLIASDGRALVSPRRLATMRRRKPVYVEGAS